MTCCSSASLSTPGRSRDLGGQLLDELGAEAGGPVTLEVEDPELDGTEEASARLRFYARHHVVPVLCAAGYGMRSQTAPGILPMLLLDIPAGRREGDLHSLALREAVRAISVRSYDRPANDPEFSPHANNGPGQNN